GIRDYVQTCALPISVAATRTLVAHVVDAFGNPVAGASVQWAAVTGGGSVAPATSSTDAAGAAQTVWTLGTTAGAQSASATVTGQIGRASWRVRVTI